MRDRGWLGRRVLRGIQWKKCPAARRTWIRATPTPRDSHITARRGLDYPLHAVSFAPLLHEGYESRMLQFADVIAHLLARQPHTAGDGGGGVRLCEFGQYLEARHAKQCRDRIDVLNDLDGRRHDAY